MFNKVSNADSEHLELILAGEDTASAQPAAAPEAEQPARAPPDPDAAPPVAGPSERDLQDYSATGLVRFRLRDAAMAVQQASPQVRTRLRAKPGIYQCTAGFGLRHQGLA